MFSKLRVFNCFALILNTASLSGHPLLPPHHQRHRGVLDPDRKPPVPVRRRRRPADPAAKVVPVLRQRHRNPLPHVIIRIQPGF